MANTDEDVIELGSSDEEREPAPKKKRPMSNVMVHIPGKLPGVTIKPATTNKPKINPVSIAKANIGKAITVTKVSNTSKLANPFANKNILNGKIITKKPANPAVPSVHSAVNAMPTIKKLRTLPIGKIPIKIARGMANPTSLQALPLGSLPPGITVKRANQLQPVSKGNIKPNPINRQVNRQVIRPPHKKATGDMVVVDLDDDEAAPCPAGPQWYLRPEEQDKKAEKPVVESSNVEEQTGSNEVEKATTETVKKTTEVEELNIREPKAPDYIEITIEDSPAKPQPMTKRTCEVLELAITIDDSPVKDVSDKQAESGSDEETITKKEKQSKKKLEYPKTAEVPETMEIEIQLTPVEDDSVQNDDKTDSQDDVTEKDIVEIVDSPLKPAESFPTSTPKKKEIQKPHPRMNDNLVTLPKPKLKVNEIRSVNVPKPQLKSNVDNTTPGEFHPIYQSFIDLCFRLENSDDMIKIVDKKIKSYYRQVTKEYTESEMFTDMVASKINAMKASPEKMYLYIKDVVDELNLQRKIAKAQPVVVTVNEEQEKLLYGEDSEFDSKRQRQIRKLEKTLKKLHRAIQKLEEQEVDFDDEEDSVYLLTERYKERMIRVHAKFCQLTNTKMPSEPRVMIDARPGQLKGPAKRLEKLINKKVPIGTPLPFPDFHDVLRCVREANQEDKLGWNEADIMEEARDLFTRCGKKLQRRRQENEWRLAASRIQSQMDPAEESDVLKKALEVNRRVASKKETEVFNKFADRQNQLNLEAVEIGDKEADESPVETDDEEATEESTSLETKEKRKERLKRLLQKTSKKDTDDSEKSDVESESHNKKAKETDSQEEEAIGESQIETDKRDKDTLSDNQSDVEKDPLSDKQNNIDNVHTLSEDSSKIDSDIDELHLLQKLRSNVVSSSTLESSDSESAIAISDTLSSGDNRKHASDVISIENSSYSESEKNELEYELVSYSQNKITTESVNVQVEIECSDAGVERIIKKSNNDEYNESVEDILLASSDDEASKDMKSEADVEQKDIKTNCENEEYIDNTDAVSMDSIEINDTLNVIKSSEVTSVTSTEVADVSPHAVEVISMDSVEAVEGDIKPDPTTEAIVQKSTVETSPNRAEPIKDIDDNSTNNDKTSDEVNNIKSGADKQNTTKDDNENPDITISRKLTESKDNATDKPDQETIELISNGNILCDNKDDITGANDIGSVEKVSNDLPVSEPMEVDDPKT